MARKLLSDADPLPVAELPVNGKDKEIKGDAQKKTFESLLSKTRITDKSNIAPVVPVVQIGTANFAIKGDISFIAGRPKSGKTTVCQFVLGTALMKEVPENLDTLNIRTTFCAGRNVVYIDTEQPKVYTKKLVDGIKTLCKLEQLPSNFYTFNWREHVHSDNREAIEILFDAMPDTHLWVIDGITDFIGSVNNEEESNDIIRFFMRKASEMGTTIVLLIHENDVTGKLRGHIGSEAERKCGGSISIKKDKAKQIHWIEPRMIRGSGDFQNIYFHYNKEAERMVLADASVGEEMERAIDPKTKKLDKLIRVVNQATLNGSEHVEKKEMLMRISLYYDPVKPVSEKTASRCLKDMLEAGLIAVDDKGKFMMLKQEDTQEQIPF